MNTMTESKNLAVQGRQKMTPSEAFVETLVAQRVTDVFGIVGSAYMDALDLFPAAGIRFISVAHEQGAGHMADGYSRVSGRHGAESGEDRAIEIPVAAPEEKVGHRRLVQTVRHARETPQAVDR